MDKLITDERLRQGAEEGMDGFLKVFTDAYLACVGGELTAETMARLTGAQHALLGYRFFHEEVMDGGFCQLVYNGYGPYITRERSDEEFMAMYELYPQFDDLEDYFIENEEQITATIAYYVDEHIEEFLI